VFSTLSRQLSPFKRVVLDANLDVILRKGSESKVEIFGAKNLLEKVTTDVNDNTLTIDNRNGCNFVRGYKHKLTVIVTSPNYEMATTNSIGTFKTEDTFAQDSMFFYSEDGDMIIDGTFRVLKTGSHGNGNVYFSGTTYDMYVYMNGTNYLYAEKGTITSYIFIEQISLADAYITAPSGGKFDYHILRTGNIYYKGDPALVSGITEKTGTVIKN
jgi:hypothetical protein